jgi:hydroxyacylglutathione hydrolase
MQAPEVHLFPCLKDNYGILVHDPSSGETAAIDTPDAIEIAKQAALKGWKITSIWNTHWHPDHAGGNLKLKEATGCEIIAPAGEAERIPGIDRTVAGGDTVRLGQLEARVIDTPGHTSGHIVYFMEAGPVAFVGDTLFALGCGRLFEGTPEQMWQSLSKLMALPPETAIYCAHEYTEANLAFSETIEPENTALRAYGQVVRARRADGLPTVPTRLDRELDANPFLRAGDPALQAAMGHPGDAVATFAEIRSRKDSF